jgi:hypothetical protein
LLYRFEDFVLDINRRELRRGDSLIAIEPQAISGFLTRIPVPLQSMTRTYAEALRAAGLPE